MLDPRNIALYEALRREAEAKTASIDPALLKRLLLAGAGGLAVGAVPAALITHRVDEAARERTRNRAFGAGMATGMAAPSIMRGLLHVARGQNNAEIPAYQEAA
jgi:hypothetical protein